MGQQLVGPISVRLSNGKQFTIEPNTPIKRVRAKAFACPACGEINNFDPYKREIACGFCGAIVGVAD